MGKNYNGPRAGSPTGKQKLSKEAIGKHNEILEENRLRREKDNTHYTKSDLQEYGNALLEDDDAVSKITARNDQINAEKRAKKEAERLKNESGSTKFFRGLVGGLSTVADVASNIIPGISGAIYQQFAPPTSMYYKG